MMKPKTTVKMSAETMGWMKNHSGPSTVCFWMATRSRRMNIHSSSRYCQISRSGRWKSGFSGVMTWVQCWVVEDMGAAEPQWRVICYGLKVGDSGGAAVRSKGPEVLKLTNLQT